MLLHILSLDVSLIFIESSIFEDLLLTEIHLTKVEKNIVHGLR